MQFKLEGIVLGRKAKKIELTQEEKEILTCTINSQKAEQRMVQRSKVILLANQGKTMEEISKETSLSSQNISKWRLRFEKIGLEGLKDKKGRGVKPTISPEDQTMVVALACSKPESGKLRRSQRDIAKEIKISQGSVHKILKRTDLKPHKTEYWCGKSPDPEFKEKQANIVGLYLNPPANALVIAVDEKTQIQALERTQKELPASPGKPRKLTATYKRQGTACLLAALLVHEGYIKGKCVDSNNNQTFLSFLKELWRTYKQVELHIIVDNLSIHKHENIKNWLKKHPRVKLHFTPTYSSWLNQVEIWFNILTRDVLKDGVWSSRDELIETIMKYITYYNENNAKPFKWTYTGQPLVK